MIYNFKIIVCFLFPFWFLVNKEDNRTQLKTIEHTLVISHPGEKSLVETVLTEVQNQAGLPVEYYMDVRSVICLEEVCKVIPVRLFWDNIGQYTKYELDEGATLEKYEADVFAPEDYYKLHTILSNTASPFKKVFIEDILTVPDELSEDIDAVSGATALELDEKDTVPGAALTCFTLWHWANGNVIANIKTITGLVSKEHLFNFLFNQEDDTYFNIAVKSLKSRKLYAPKYTTAVYNRLLDNEKLLKTGLLYLESAPLDVYLSTLHQLIVNGNKEQKLAVIRSLNTSSQSIPKSFLDGVSKEFSNLKSFHEVSILLELMQTKNTGSATVIKQVMPLLNGNFIAARRVYWFLKTEKLNDTQTKLVQDFYKAHKDRL
ncbi:hypothetical protein GCM10022291_30820 [Postechiella marina]|uniref:Uncharacterized protein n=1 Tax=Postechiella marina TaxID=943941 RepID=A0ABP8CG16_9FLAO